LKTYIIFTLVDTNNVTSQQPHPLFRSIMLLFIGLYTAQATPPK